MAVSSESTPAGVAAGSPYFLRDVSSVLSPSLLVFRDLVRVNLEAMIAMAGSADRLRPHAKTHKMPAIIRMAGEMGISKHKCAVLSEAEMIARSGGRDILVAYPLVGPNLARLSALRDRYPEAVFRVALDDADVARALSRAMVGRGSRPLSVLVDLDVGMGRTGLAPEEVEGLYRLISTLPGLRADGLHAYDGHIRETDPEARKLAAAPGLAIVREVRSDLESRGMPVPLLVLGGTPTFPIHAAVADPGVECSPGTCVLHDAGYGERFPDLPFVPAALLLTRVVSRPRPGRLCLDLGHKAVAADPAGARIRLPGMDHATIGPQSEEHLIVETDRAAEFPPGTPLLAIPVHVCPTCALHRRAAVVEGGVVVEEWEIEARDRAPSDRV